jgi:hypothetical protein
LRDPRAVNLFLCTKPFGHRSAPETSEKQRDSSAATTPDLAQLRERLKALCLPSCIINFEDPLFEDDISCLCIGDSATGNFTLTLGNAAGCALVVA